MEGWIKIHRAILDWEWFDKPEMVKFFIYCLCKANFEDRKWRGIEIKRGQFLTSLDNMSVETKLSKQTLRTCIARLKSTQEITHQSTRTYTIITLCNYDAYQQQENEANTPSNTQTNTPPTHDQHTANTPPTHDQHTANTPPTPTKELKNIRIKELKKEDTHTDGGDAALPVPSEIVEVDGLESSTEGSTAPKLEPEEAPPLAAAPPSNESEPKDPPPKMSKTLAERVQGVVDYFNKTCASLPKVKELTDPRRKAIAARLEKYGSDPVREVIDKAAASEFLNGANDQGWKANFDWVMKPVNFIKIRENTYNNAQPTNITTSRPSNPGGSSRSELEATKRAERRGLAGLANAVLSEFTGTQGD